MNAANNLSFEAHDLIDRAIQAGRDQMAQALADLLTNPEADAGAEGYRDGIEDALITLVNHGATDPRPAKQDEPTVCGFELDDGSVAYYEV
jgi:hypothetical protein